jgi:uncharacterized membrane protein
MKIKIFITALIWIAYSSFEKYLYPLVSNNVAVNQFEDSSQSFIVMQGWNTFNDFLPIVLFIITVCLYKSDIKNLTKEEKEENE